MSASKPSKEDDSDDESTAEREWVLGFVDAPLKRTDLLRHRFPSKVGGRPAWLNPVDLPLPHQITCNRTSETMRFLLQIYAPVDANPRAFHRMIYVFISTDGSQLHKPGAVKALRCQMPRHNRFYSETPPRREDVLPRPLSSEELLKSLSSDPWKSLAGEAIASATMAAKVAQQPAGDACGGASPPMLKPEETKTEVQVFPELELVVETEPNDQDESGVDVKTRDLMAQYRAREEQEGAYTDAEMPNEVIDDIEQKLHPQQRHFASFASRIAREPAQVLRYCFEKDAVPLCPSSLGIPSASDIPSCTNCGGPRKFEFQIMPQLLNNLDVDAADPRAPDWGTVAVYSCAASCDGSVVEDQERETVGGSAYLEEYVWVQPSA